MVGRISPGGFFRLTVCGILGIDLTADALIGSQVGGRYFAGFKVGEITLLFGVDALVVGLQVCQQFEVLLLRFVTVS